jgi:hypothetical protein
MRLNFPSHRTLPLATQLSATPPARQRFAMPVSAASVRVRRRTTCSVTAWTEAAMSISRWLIGSSLRRGLPPNSSSNRSIVEVALIDAESAVGPEVDEMVEDELSVFGFAVRGEAHHLSKTPQLVAQQAAPEKASRAARSAARYGTSACPSARRLDRFRSVARNEQRLVVKYDLVDFVELDAASL